jgi:hypothetical protein
MWYSNLENNLFLDISSTNIDTLVSSLYRCVETRSIEVFWLLSHSLPHLIGRHLKLSNVNERISQPSSEPLYATNTSHHIHDTFLYEYPFHWVVLLTKNAQQNDALRYFRHFDYWNQPLNMSMRVCYLYCHEAGLCCYLAIRMKPITSVTVVFHLWPILLKFHRIIYCS